MHPTAILKNHQNLIFRNFEYDSRSSHLHCDVEEPTFNITISKRAKIFVSREIMLPVNPASLNPFNITYSKPTNTCTLQTSYGLSGGGICGGKQANPNKTGPSTSPETPLDDGSMQKLQKENPFLAAILSLTHEKDDHMKNSLLNASNLEPTKLTIEDIKSFNTYDPSTRIFKDLIHFWAKGFHTTTQVSATLGDCRKDVWALALCKWAWKWLGEINFYLNFGEHTGFVYGDPNPYDKEIDEALAIMNNPKNDHKEIAWTYEFCHNLRTIYYYNTAIHKSLEYTNLLDKIKYFFCDNKKLVQQKKLIGKSQCSARTAGRNISASSLGQSITKI
jgi:hypothetical protein